MKPWSILTRLQTGLKSRTTSLGCNTTVKMSGHPWWICEICVDISRFELHCTIRQCNTWGWGNNAPLSNIPVCVLYVDNVATNKVVNAHLINFHTSKLVGCHMGLIVITIEHRLPHPAKALWGNARIKGFPVGSITIQIFPAQGSFVKWCFEEV